MKISDNARLVLERRYLARDGEGQPVETVEGLFRRVADAIADAETVFDAKAETAHLSDAFYEAMTNLEFLPNSPTLMNAGRPLGQLSACFVLPVEDSMESIFDAVKQAALIHKSGGGTGFSFSRLRPVGAAVNSTGGVASGPVSFMKVFNAATEAVKQGGTRRGANMGMLRIDHPDILSFIDCKKDGSEITNFNISVALTEDFVQAARAGENYPLIDPRNGSVGELNAAEVYTQIVEAAWRNGEPGILFLDRVNRDNVTPKAGDIESTNPCGEQPLLPYESCNLGSVNLSEMLFASGAEIDWKKLEKTVRLAVRFLDNVIEVNRYPLELIDQTTKRTRKVGLGVMGWADMLIALKIPYNSDAAVRLAGEVMGFIDRTAKEESAALADTRGAFPALGESTLTSPRRNATLTTIAPTGTLSIIAGVSSGVEPVFAMAYVRNVMDGTRLTEVNPALERVLGERGLLTTALREKIACEGTLAHIPEIPEDIRSVFVCAHDIAPEWHVRMQAAFQKFTDNAVSKTVNFPNSATVEDVRRVYDLAYDLGCKGVTIYRDGSRSGQVLNVGATVESKASESCAVDDPGCDDCRQPMPDRASPPLSPTPRARAEFTQGLTAKCAVGCGNLYVTVNFDDRGICEVFTNTGKSGGCPSQSEASARLATLAFRAGIDPRHVVRQLRGIRCPSCTRNGRTMASSCPDAIAQVVVKVLHMENPHVETGSLFDEVSENGPLCPDCGAALAHEGGCVNCHACGYSKCN